MTGQTAAEIIYKRADAEKPTMGLTTWKDSPNGKILKRDTVVANNRRKVLDDKGTVFHENAVKKAAKEYEIFRVKQDQEYMSEFDKQTEKYFRGE